MNKDKTLEYIKNKFNIDLSARLPIEIPNFGRDGLAKLIAELNFNTGAEIGVERGVYSEVLLQANPNLTLYCIDSWHVYHGYRDHTNQITMDKIYEDAKLRLEKYNCLLIKKKSHEAVVDFPHESLDFVYIDASHEFSHVAHDIVEWSKRVRPGGIVAGHDYVKKKSTEYQSHVVEVVNSYTRAYEIAPWFVLGTKEIISGETRDRPRSWMFVKLPEVNLRPHSF